MLAEAVGVLAGSPAATCGAASPLFVDCTLGRAGHATQLLERVPSAQVLGVDRDRAALGDVAWLHEAEPRLLLAHASFCEIPGITRAMGADGRVAGMIADLGVSSIQLDEAARGFSFRGGLEPLDMRFDQSADPPLSPGHGGVRLPAGTQFVSTRAASPFRASQLLRGVSEPTLARALTLLANEPKADRIAALIADEVTTSQPGTRGSALDSCGGLASLVAAAAGVERHRSPGRGRRVATHPATRTFQAVRMLVNDELGDLTDWLAAAPWELAPGGRVAVLTFHSLEDALVTAAFRRLLRLPGREFRKPASRATAGPTPSAEELEHNPRARSARLRVIERVSGGSAPPSWSTAALVRSLPRSLAAAVGIAGVARREAERAAQPGDAAAPPEEDAAEARRRRRGAGPAS